MPASGYMSYFQPGYAWYVLAAMASLVAVLGYGLTMAIARALHMNELERWSKSEILQTIATMVMVVTVIALLTQVEAFSLGYFFGVQTDPNTGAITATPTLMCGDEQMPIASLKNSLELLKCRIASRAITLAKVQKQVTEAAGAIFNLLSIYVSLIGLPIFQGNYVTAWFRTAETYRLINNTATVLLISLNTLIVTIDYISNNMLALYLPTGLLLRSFHYTRGLGAFFIAMAIGFYFIFPTLYIITDPGFVKPSYTPPPVSTQKPLCYPTFSSVTYSIYSSTQGSISSSSEELSQSELKSSIASVYTSILVHPFIVLAATLVFVRYSMYVLGGEPMELMRAVGRLV